jgi:hypothetical protein
MAAWPAPVSSIHFSQVEMVDSIVHSHHRFVSILLFQGLCRMPIRYKLSILLQFLLAKLLKRVSIGKNLHFISPGYWLFWEQQKN